MTRLAIEVREEVAKRFAAVLAVATLAAACSRRAPPPPPPPPSPLEVDRHVLDDALHQCFTLDCDAAHQRVLQLSESSALRQSDEFRAIEFHYEVNELLRADREPDLDKQRSMLDTLRNTTSAAPELRTAAGQMLARLGGGQRFELALPGPDGGAASAAGASSEETAKIAALLKSKKPSDYALARALIEPRIYEGKATPDDVRAMMTICKAQKDTRCLKTIQTLKLH
jgi:hypothetical protein